MNPIILNNTFKYLSTSFLLSSCSLVSKAWNRVARVYIRNNRKCKVANPHVDSISTCQLVHDVRYRCGQMRQQGREVPFNGLSIQLLDHGGKQCSKYAGCDGGVHINLPSEIKLKYFSIICSSDYAPHHVQDPSTKLIRDHASEIQELTVCSVLLLKFLLNSSDQHLFFPKLEEISIGSKISYNKTVQKNIIRSLHAKAPRLVKIFADSPSLKILPEEFYGLLGNLTFYEDDEFEEDQFFVERLLLFRHILDQRPKLRQLHIFEAREASQATRNLMTQLLQSCQDILEDFSFSVDDLHILRLISNMKCKNLSSLYLQSSHMGAMDQLWNLLRSIDVEKMMPKLEEMEIHMADQSLIKCNGHPGLITEGSCGTPTVASGS